MPNWCSNTLTVSLLEETKESTKQLKQFSKDAKGEEEVLELQKMFPIPSELVGTTAPATVVSDSEYEKIHEKEVAKYAKNENLMKAFSISESMSNSLIEKHGFNNWYDWCIKNWGTKWDVSESSIVGNTKKEITYCFDTAWSPPLQAIEKISSNYPLLKFNIEYSESGAGFRGEAEFENGECISNESEDFEEDDED